MVWASAKEHITGTKKGQNGHLLKRIVIVWDVWAVWVSADESLYVHICEVYFALSTLWKVWVWGL